MKVCIRCGEEFESLQWNQKQCYDCLEKNDKRFKGRQKKECPSCGKEFIPRTIRQTFCSTGCQKEKTMDSYYKKRYGISEQEKKKMVKERGSKCDICGTQGFKMNPLTGKLVVDHCHSSGTVRGILCHNCNRALGLFKDDPEILEKAIHYLQISLEGSETIRKE
jgi:hypothetical protein